MILVDALYINKGGGAVLLDYLIECIMAHARHQDFFFLLDPRYKRPAVVTQNYIVIPNKMAERKRFYKENKNRFTKVLCFANTPPPVRLSATVYTYFHNQKLLEAPHHRLQRSHWRMYAKYLVCRLFNANTDFYIVQTPHMVREMLRLKMKPASAILSIPFYDDRRYRSGSKPFAERPAGEFVFISNPSPQKNYPALLAAWGILLDKGIEPVLHVTVDDTAPAITQQMNALIERGARIFNHVYIDPKELYFNCPYLIFPSLVESFGLPLIEAAESGMKILASDLEFVYDVVTPSATFNQSDPHSIADAVTNAMTNDLPFPKIIAVNEIDKLMALLTK